MKIKLTINDIPDKDYVTIDPMPISGPAYVGSIISLDGVCDKAEVVELLGEKILDYIPHNKLEEAITGWCALLRHGGKIILGGVNTNEISRLWVTKHISPEDYNKHIFGDGSVRKAAAYSIEQIERVLLSRGIKITRKSLPGLYFVIEGERP